VGEKTAAALVAGYGGIEGIIEALERGESSSPLAKVRRDLDYVETFGPAFSLS
jgi:5'-3' exonuclease